MSPDRLDGQDVNDGEIATPRLAATMVLMREGAGGPELLMLRRNPAQRFMGGMWVFPGGAHDEDDPDLLATALRELEEEAGIRLEEPDAPLFARWVTPELLKIRFDASFFLAEAPDGTEVRIDGNECVDVRWIRPADALAAAERGEMALPFPTVHELRGLAEFASVAEALAAVREREVVPFLPHIDVEARTVEVETPEEPA